MQGILMFLSEKEIDLAQIKGVGVSATGQIDDHSGVVIGSGGSVQDIVAVISKSA